jgi:hypothetical protein
MVDARDPSTVQYCELEIPIKVIDTYYLKLFILPAMLEALATARPPVRGCGAPSSRALGVPATGLLG